MADRVTIDKATVRGARYLVTTSDGETVRIDRETVFKHCIFKGHDFEPDEWQRILRESEEQICFNAILSMLNRRMHTEMEIRRKLYKKSLPKDVIQHGMAHAEELGLLDDAKFARMFVEEKFELNGWGRRRIESELYKRGVGRQLIQNALEDYFGDDGEEAEYQSLKITAERKLEQLKRREDDPFKLKKKLLAHLASRGFGPSLCYRVINELL